MKQLITLFSMAVMLCPAWIKATTLTWIGSPTDSLMSTQTNWSPNGSFSSADTLIFDGQATSNALYDISFQLNDIILDSTFDKTFLIDTGAYFTCQKSFAIYGGTFKATNHRIQFQGPVQLIGGQFITPDDETRFQHHFTYRNTEIVDQGNLVSFNSSTSHQLDLGGRLEFENIYISTSSGKTTSMSTKDTLAATNSFELNRTSFYGGVIEAPADSLIWNVNTRFRDSSALKLVGPGVLNFDGERLVGKLIMDDPGQEVNFTGTATYIYEGVDQSAGVLNLRNTHTVFVGDYHKTGGTLLTDSGRVDLRDYFDHPTMTLDFDQKQTFYYLTLGDNSNAMELDVAITGDTVVVSQQLDIKQGSIIQGVVHALNGVAHGSGFQGGEGILYLSGSQTLYLNSGNMCGMHLNHPESKAYCLSKLMNIDGPVHIEQGTLDLFGGVAFGALLVDDGTFVLQGPFNALESVLLEKGSLRMKQGSSLLTDSLLIGDDVQLVLGDAVSLNLQHFVAPGTPDLIYDGTGAQTCFSVQQSTNVEQPVFLDLDVVFCLAEGIDNQGSDPLTWTANVDTACSSCATGCVTANLSGQLDYPTNDGFRAGYIELIKPNSIGLWKPVAYKQTGPTGLYEFNNIAGGEYIIKAYPVTAWHPEAIPTYFPGEVQWDSAQIVTFVCNETTMIDAPMVDKPVVAGTGVVSGTILYGGTNKTSAGEPVDGANVILINAAEANGIHTTTNAAGYYEFTGLESGAYSLVVDIPGLDQAETYEFDLDVNGIDQLTELDFVADTMDAIYINGIITNVQTPMVERAGNQFKLATSDQYEISYYNMNGQLVHRSSEFGQTITLPQLPDGWYIARIIGSLTTWTGKVGVFEQVVQRK